MGIGSVTSAAPARQRAIFLDRDGVLNKVAMKGAMPCPLSVLGDLEILPAVRQALLALRDAGRNAGCTTVLVGHGYKEGLRSTLDKTAASLPEAVEWILQQNTIGNGHS
jgi:histidinol phosphatase-like enzyme